MRRLSQEIPFKLDVCTAQFYFVSSGLSQGVVDLSIIISAVIALAAELMVGWLATKARADQIRADLEERRGLDIELSAARQQLAQEAHWREGVSC